MSDLGDAVVVFATDGWDVVTFPKDLDRSGWYTLGGTVALGGLLYAYDGEIQDWFRRNRGEGLNGAIGDVGDFFEPVGNMGNTNKFYLAGLVTGYASGWEPLQHASADILLSHWIASITRQSVRWAVGRHRPEEGLGPYEFERGEGTSFPSGHASSIVQVATVFSHHLDFWPATAALWGIAGAVSFQRVDSEGHWASDTWIGAMWGWGVSQVVLRNAEARRRDGRAPAVRPFVDPSTGMLGFSIPLP